MQKFNVIEMDASVETFKKLFSKAIDCDLWGQRIEAVDNYQRCLETFQGLKRPKLDDKAEVLFIIFINNFIYTKCKL